MPITQIPNHNYTAGLQPYVRNDGPPIKFFEIEFDVEFIGARWLQIGGSVSGDLSFTDLEGLSHTMKDLNPGVYFFFYLKINSSGTDFAEDILLGAS